MNTIFSAQNLRRAGALVAAVLAAAGATAQYVPAPVHWTGTSTLENWASFSAALVSVDGNEATYQRMQQHHRNDFIGMDGFRLKLVPAQDHIVTADGALLIDDDTFRLHVRYENTATGFYVDAGGRQSHVFYDGSGGYFPVNGQWFVPFDPALAIDRGEAWIEAGLANEKTSVVLRYTHQYRNGEKDSTAWADTNVTGLTGSTAARYIVPSFYEIDEFRDTFTAKVTQQVQENVTVGAGGTWETIKADNERKIVRRPGESVERRVTQRDKFDNDLFSLHGYTEIRPGDKLTLTGAAAHTKIDTNFTGSRIIGFTYDAIFDPAFSRRQARDEGFFGLVGDSQWKQTLLTGNVMYLPAKHWRISAGVRYENQTQDAVAEFDETAVGTTSALITAIDELESESSRDFDELLGTAEITYTGVENMVWSGFVEAADGNGTLREELTELENGVIDIARDTDFDRTYSKYGITGRWYPAVGLNFAAGAYHKVRDNDYDTADDSTPNNGADRYPAYIRFQRFSTDDIYVRGTWRPTGTLSLIGRYDRQQTDIDSREDGLASVLSSEMTTHILAGTVNWTPAANLVVQGTINYVYDQVLAGSANSTQPIARQAGRFDNNYRTATLVVFYAVNEQTDVQLDGSLYQTNNFQDVSALSVAYGLTARDRSYGVSVNRRVSADLAFGVRYAHTDYDDATSGGRRDFSADLIYGRVQLRF